MNATSNRFAEIGERVGITRERVRQIARQLGMTSGRQRQQQRVVDQRMSAWCERKGHRELIAKCKPHFADPTVTVLTWNNPKG